MRGAGCTVVAVRGAFDRRGSLRDFLRPEPARSLRRRQDTGPGVPLLVEAHLGVRQHRQSGGPPAHVGALGMTSAGADRGVSGGAGARAVSRTRKHEINQIALRIFDVLGVVLIAGEAVGVRPAEPNPSFLAVVDRDEVIDERLLLAAGEGHVPLHVGAERLVEPPISANARDSWETRSLCLAWLRTTSQATRPLRTDNRR